VGAVDSVGIGGAGREAGVGAGGRKGEAGAGVGGRKGEADDGALDNTCFVHLFQVGIMGLFACLRVYMSSLYVCRMSAARPPCRSLWSPLLHACLICLYVQHMYIGLICVPYLTCALVLDAVPQTYHTHTHSSGPVSCSTISYACLMYTYV